MDLGVIAMKGHSKAPGLVKCHIKDTRLEVKSNPSAEMQSVYSTAPAN